MPVLPNARHESFAQEVAAGKSFLEAAQIAGFKRGTSAKANARKLSHRRDVKARIAEIQAIGAKGAEVTVEKLITEAELARLKAMKEKAGASAAISAVTCKAKLAGLWREKVAMTDPTGMQAAPFIVEIVRFSDAAGKTAA